MTKVTLSTEKQMLKVTINFDLDEVNAIIDTLNLKKKKKQKDKRSLKFADAATTRDFIYHLKRLYHWHNCSRNVENFEKTRPILKVEGDLVK